MKYECTIIIYKENKHMNVSYNVSYNVKNNYEKSIYSIELEILKDHFFGF